MSDVASFVTIDRAFESASGLLSVVVGGDGLYRVLVSPYGGGGGSVSFPDVGAARAALGVAESALGSGLIEPGREGEAAWAVLSLLAEQTYILPEPDDGFDAVAEGLAEDAYIEQSRGI